MLTPTAFENMKNDAELALTRSYGYPEARLHCAHHVLTLLEELKRVEAILNVAHGDWSEIRKLAGKAG